MNNENEVHVQFKQGGEPCELRLVNFGHHKTPPGYTYGPLMRDFALIHFIVSGCGHTIIDGVRYNLTDGQVFLFQPNQIHYYQSDPSHPWEYYYIGFTGEETQEILTEAGFGGSVVGRTIPEIQSLFQLLRALCDTADDPMQPLLQRSYLCRILHQLVRSSKADSEIIKKSDKAKLTPDYAHIASGILHHSFSERNISVETLAERLGISSGYLNSLFRAAFGKSVYQYLVEHRVRIAGELLEMTNKPIRRICLEVGYDDPLYFSRIFKKYTGVTPSEFRRKGQERREML